MAFAASLVDSAVRLPDRVASHFDIHGVANGWMNRSTHLLLMGCLGIGLPMFIVALFSLARAAPWMLNIPHRDEWLAPERKDATLDFLVGHSLWLACLSLALITALNVVVTFANHENPPHLSTATALGLTGGFLTGVVVWVVVLYRRFRIPSSA